MCLIYLLLLLSSSLSFVIVFVFVNASDKDRGKISSNFFGFCLCVFNVSFSTRCLQLRGWKHLGRDRFEGFPPDQLRQCAHHPQQLPHHPPHRHPDPQYGSEVTNNGRMKVNQSDQRKRRINLNASRLFKSAVASAILARCLFQ